MPSCCCVPSCKGNYHNSGLKVSVFRFPKDEIIRKKWVLAICPRRKDFTIMDNTVVCENHFKKTDIETEISAYDSKTGKTLTVPLINKRLKIGVIPSIFQQSLNSTSSASLPSREDPDEKRMRIEKEQLCLALQKSLKENDDTAQLDGAAGLSRLSEDNRQKKTKRKKSDKEISRKKAKNISNSSSEENSQSNDISQSHNMNKSRKAFQSSKDLLKKKDAKIQQQNQNVSQTAHSQKTKSFVSATRENAENTEVQIKQEPPWEEEYNVSVNTSKNKPQENSKDKEANETVLESCDIAFYKKPLKIDKRDDAFGKFVACEMSDLHGNPELYLKTQQSILKILVEAHFELMSAT